MYRFLLIKVADAITVHSAYVQRPILSQEKPEHDVLGNDHQETQKDQKRFTTFQVHAVGKILSAFSSRDVITNLDFKHGNLCRLAWFWPS